MHLRRGSILRGKAGRGWRSGHWRPHQKGGFSVWREGSAVEGQIALNDETDLDRELAGSLWLVPLRRNAVGLV